MNNSIKKNFLYFETAAVILCIVIAVLLLVLLLFTNVFSPEKEPDSAFSQSPTAVQSSNTASSASAVTPQTSPAATNALKYSTLTLDNAQIKSGSLILVNNQYKCTVPESDKLLKLYENKSSSYKLGTGDEVLLKDTITQLNAMIDDFNAATELENVTLINAYIDIEAQNKIYNSAVAELGEEQASIWAQQPGGSDHQTGLGFNLSLYPAKGGKIGEGEYKWITENACYYGFIRRFPADKSNITYVKDDINHFRYVGIPHAYYMYENSLCLEEYIPLLKAYTPANPLEIKVKDITYMCYFVPSSSGTSTDISVPESYTYTVSGNNADGFVVTYSK